MLHTTFGTRFLTSETLNKIYIIIKSITLVFRFAEYEDAELVIKILSIRNQLN